MRWRFVDRIEVFDPWTTIRGRKVVSLEEYLLLDRFGRQGVFPETLVLESCVHLARWLVVRSSDFDQSCLLTAVDGFAWQRAATPGDSLRVSITVRAKEESNLYVDCAVENGEPVATGALTLTQVALNELADAKASKALWRELYGAA